MCVCVCVCVYVGVNGVSILFGEERRNEGVKDIYRGEEIEYLFIYIYVRVDRYVSNPNDNQQRRNSNWEFIPRQFCQRR